MPTVPSSTALPTRDESIGMSNSLQTFGEDDSSEWVWSNASSVNEKAEAKSKSTAVSSTSKTQSRKANSGDDLLIDFGENRTKKSSPPVAPKVKTAEEEAWDMLNS